MRHLSLFYFAANSTEVWDYLWRNSTARRIYQASMGFKIGNGVGKMYEKLWLHEGWPEFSKHYTYHLLVFRYEGNSMFSAVIFDDNNVEIEYPHIPAQLMKLKESYWVDMFGDLSFSLDKQSPIPSSWHHNRRKTTHSGNEMKVETSKRIMALPTAQCQNKRLIFLPLSISL